MVCHAHAHSARVVYLTDYPKAQLSNATARAAFAAASLQRVQSTNTDGINFDIEGDTTNRDGLTRLVQETQAVFTAWDANTQVRCAAKETRAEIRERGRGRMRARERGGYEK
jgi:hypothetical protein